MRAHIDWGPLMARPHPQIWPMVAAKTSPEARTAWKQAFRRGYDSEGWFFFFFSPNQLSPKP